MSDYEGIIFARLLDLANEYEDALDKTPEPGEGERAFPNTLELIDLVVRVIHECEHLTDSLRTDLADFEDDINVRRQS